MPIIRTKLRDQVAEGILKLIRDRGLQPSDQLPGERELEAEFGVSRTVIREALNALENKGAIEVRQGRGTTVKMQFGDVLSATMRLLLSQHTHRLTQLLEVRMIVEREAARIAAERANAEDLLAMKMALDDMEQDLDLPRGYVGADVLFHDSLLKSAHNDLLYEMFAPVYELLATSREVTANRRRRPQCALDEHRAIYDRIAARDSDGAGRAMEEHLAATAADLSQALSTQ